MTATDELRRMLDERGEYYRTSGNRTWWGRPIDAQTGKPINVFYNQAQPMGDDRLLVELQLATPAQAISGTLGSGTCHYEIAFFGDGKAWFACSKCGGMTSADYDPPRYCPHCGARIVEVDE